MAPLPPHKNKVFSSATAVAVLSLSAFLTRLLPLSVSQFPFNNDALSVCGISSDIMNTHRLADLISPLWQNAHGVRTPLLSIIISYFASATGTTPLHCAQFVDASLAMVTVGGLFILTRAMTGRLLGAMASGFMATMMGTFVFTTGSVWNESLGIALLVLLLIAFVHRSQLRFRLLTFAVLMMLPLAHHLVALVGFLIIAYLLVWSWFFAIATRSLRKRQFVDLGIVGVATVWAVSYYVVVDFDRLSDISSPVKLALLLSSFVILSLVATVILMPRRYSKMTFAPFIGVGLLVVLVLDYLGLVFPYSHSASNLYILLIAAACFLFSLAWYGTEVLIETRPAHRAVQVALALSPLTLIGFGLLQGFSTASHQVVYRTFDFLDIFIFVGAGAALCAFRDRHKKLYPLIGTAMVVSLVISFPFAYASEQLLGVRHDTQAFEVDALEWIDGHTNAIRVISDERISYISWSMFGLMRDSGLPLYLKHNVTILPGWMCVIEDRWTKNGVNAYPEGNVVVPEPEYTRVQLVANVLYIGGPPDDRAIIFVGSGIGQRTMP